MDLPEESLFKFAFYHQLSHLSNPCSPTFVLIKMAEKVNVVTGKEQAKVKLFTNGSHGDAVIKTVENVADNLYLVDGILFPDGKNPYRSSHYEPIQITE